MRSQVWSLLERLFPRLSSSVITLLLASVISPAKLGVYSGVVIGLTLIQSVTDGAIRQIAVVGLKTKNGIAFLSSYAKWSSALGSCALFVLLLGVSAWLPHGSSRDVWLLAPVVALPLCQAARVKAVAYLQISGAWSTLANAQLMSAVVSFALSLPVLYATHSLLACSVQLLVSEACFSWSCVLRARKSGMAEYVRSRAVGNGIRAEFGHISTYSLLGWLQGQADRILLAGIAGPARLGLYSLSWSMSRSIGDAISNSTANVLRPSLSGHEHNGPDAIKARCESVLLRAVPLSGGVIIATWLGSKYVLPHLLSSEWKPAIDAVPIMSLSILPTLMSWSLTVVLIARKRLRWAAPVKAVGVLFAVPVAYAASVDLEVAAWAVVARELVGAVLMVVVAGRACPLRALSFATGTVVAMGGAIAVVGLA